MRMLLRASSCNSGGPRSCNGKVRRLNPAVASPHRPAGRPCLLAQFLEFDEFVRLRAFVAAVLLTRNGLNGPIPLPG